MMRFEVYNFADGRRTRLEVYEAVAAEALVRRRVVLRTGDAGRRAGRARARGRRGRLHRQGRPLISGLAETRPAVPL